MNPEVTESTGGRDGKNDQRLWNQKCWSGLAFLSPGNSREVCSALPCQERGTVASSHTNTPAIKC